MLFDLMVCKFHIWTCMSYKSIAYISIYQIWGSLLDIMILFYFSFVFLLFVLSICLYLITNIGKGIISSISWLLYVQQMPFCGLNKQIWYFGLTDSIYLKNKIQYLMGIRLHSFWKQNVYWPSDWLQSSN